MLIVLKKRVETRLLLLVTIVDIVVRLIILTYLLCL